MFVLAAGLLTGGKAEELTMYQAKTLFTGYKLGIQDARLYVAIPEKVFKHGHVTAKYDYVYKHFEQDKAVLTREFQDKYNPDKSYKLLYFKW